MNNNKKILGKKPNTWTIENNIIDMSRPAKPMNLITFNAGTHNLKIDLEKTAIIIIDMINDFCTQGGFVDSLGADINITRKPVKPLNKLLKKLRHQKIPILWVNWGNRSDKADLTAGTLHIFNPNGEKNSVPLEKNQWSSKIIKELKTDKNDIYVDKFRMNGFSNTQLDSILRNLGITTLLFAGVNLDQCVYATLAEANFLGYDCILIDDCSATLTPKFCKESTLFNIKMCYGFITSSDNIIDAI